MSGSDGVTTVDPDGLPGDVSRTRPREEGNHVGEFPGRAEPPHRDCAPRRLECFYSGRRARMRGLTKVSVDFSLLAAAVNVGRLATLGLTSAIDRTWTVATALPGHLHSAGRVLPDAGAGQANLGASVLRTRHPRQPRRRSPLIRSALSSIGLSEPEWTATDTRPVPQP